MIYRTTNTEDLAMAAESVDFNVEEWITNGNNIALKSKGGDLGLFEYVRDGVYNGHWFFTSRGKAAIGTAGEMIREAFSAYPVEVIIGYVPLEHLGSRWLARHMGFTSNGALTTTAGPCELFILTKKEWQTHG